MPEPEEVLVARGTDVEPLLRSTRAEIAQLSLQLRAATHEAEQLEAALGEDDTSALHLLRTSLDELVESRRHELEQALEQELVRAAAVVAAAQEEAARARLAVPAEAPPAEAAPADLPMPPPQLRVVADAPFVGDEREASEPERAQPEVDDPDEPEDDRSPTPAVDVPTDPALLRELVSAAVSAAVSQALGAAQTASRPPGAGWPSPSEATAPHPVVPLQGPRRRTPVRRQLLHVDVILPLVLVVIVFVVLLAWAG